MGRQQRGLTRSFGDALRGLWHVVRSERNARIHLAGAAAALIAAAVLRLGREEIAAVVFAIVVVFWAELANSMLERLLDLVHPEHSEQVRLIKDVGAAAVLVAAIGAAAIGVLVFGPHLAHLTRLLGVWAVLGTGPVPGAGRLPDPGSPSARGLPPATHAEAPLARGGSPCHKANRKRGGAAGVIHRVGLDAERPSAEELRELTGRMPNARRTGYGSLNIATRVRDRARQATFVVADDPPAHAGPSLSRDEGAQIAALQDRYLQELARGRSLVAVEGFIGHGGPHRVTARLLVERGYANLAAMQRHLYFQPEAGREHSGAPELTVACTPGLRLPGFPGLGGTVVAVWPEEGLTRIVGSDLFGEAKKAGIRLWAERVHAAGGLVLHAGCAVLATSAGPRAMLLCGQQGTGKSTLAFRLAASGAATIAQDDFVALLPDGGLVASEAGCIEKTFGLDPDATPALHGAVTRPDAYLENTAQRGDWPDFANRANPRGRAVFPLRSIPHRPADEVPPLSLLVILNRHDGAVPAVTWLGRDPQRAADAWLLREQRAGEPVWTPRQATPAHRRQRDRLAELLARHPVEAFSLNTGRVGGPAGDPRSKPVALAATAAIVRAIAAGTIAWDGGADNDGQLASAVPGVEDLDLLQPRRLYQRQGRLGEYRERRAQLAAENARFLGQ